MLELVRSFYSIFIWIFLIVCVIIGLFLGWQIGNEVSQPIAIIGLLIGGVLGLGFFVIVGGMTVIILNIDKNIQKIADNNAKSKVENVSNSSDKEGDLNNPKVLNELINKLNKSKN